jgi:hypothetical protein
MERYKKPLPDGMPNASARPGCHTLMRRITSNPDIPLERFSIWANIKPMLPNKAARRSGRARGPLKALLICAPP